MPCWESDALHAVDPIPPPTDPFAWSTFFMRRDQTHHLEQYCTWLAPRATQEVSKSAAYTGADVADDAATSDDAPSSQEPDDHMDIVPADRAPIVCRRPLGVIGGCTPEMDKFLLAVLLGHGVRLVNAQHPTQGFDVYDYMRYFNFSQSLSSRESRHRGVLPDARLKALLVWLRGDTTDLIKHIQHGAAHPCCRLVPHMTHVKKMADRYTAMHTFIKAYL